MKLYTPVALLFVLGSTSAFVFPVAVRSGATRLQQSSQILEEADKAKAREALIESPGMEELLKMIGSSSEDEPDKPDDEPAPEAAQPVPPAEE